MKIGFLNNLLLLAVSSGMLLEPEVKISFHSCNDLTEAKEICSFLSFSVEMVRLTRFSKADGI